MKTKKCIYIERSIEPYQEYGTFRDLDMLVNSANVEDRLRAVKFGYGLDKLKDDTNSIVRAAVARTGFYKTQFITDVDEMVRKSVKWRVEKN